MTSTAPPSTPAPGPHSPGPNTIAPDAIAPDTIDPGAPAGAGSWTPIHLAALIAANVLLAMGPWLVRLADTGPVAAAFWRLSIAFPVLAALAWREGRGRPQLSGRTLALLLAGGLFFGLDLAAWHVGIAWTRLGNAALLGNAGSIILMFWGLVAARRMPRVLEVGAIASSLAGAALLMGESLEISPRNLRGDLFCLLAGFFYAFYILFLQRARARGGQFVVLVGSMLASIPVVLLIAMLRGEAILPHDWTPLLVLALTSQICGQGLLVYSLGNFPPFIVGLALLLQPAVASLIGWLAFGETLGATDLAGMALVAGALVLAKIADAAPGKG